MAKFLFIGNYTAEGARGVIKDGGSKRRAAGEAVLRSVGGSVEAFYFAFGADDFYLIADMPDSASAAAASMVVAASGALSLKTVVLLTPEEIDAAAGMSVSYTPPGG
ncbi:MAG TPA: GYD domain-containing protein [Candidatus Limnocylindrales bacterium]|jgi:uncharacterized protein with GYD domain|nr:GYD domain-containing protein [Candidatus Limnocylindrales bacterium]